MLCCLGKLRYWNIVHAKGGGGEQIHAMVMDPYLPTAGRVHNSIEKPLLSRCTMVYENHRWAGARWCTKTAVGQVCDGV